MNKGVSEIGIDNDTWLEVSNIGSGVFSPLRRFMDSKNYRAVVEDMHLADGSSWTIPVTLDAPEDQVNQVRGCQRLELKNSANNVVAEVEIEDIFKVNYENDLTKVFGTNHNDHPGVMKERRRSPYRVGGKVMVIAHPPPFFPQYDLAPAEVRRIFQHRQWQTIAGFQTRNPPHRAHEYLQRIGLEVCEGVFVQPLIGWKKVGDFSPEAIMGAYEVMIRRFYPEDRVVLGTLRTPMRYAGPREAVFHALIRKNYGCTHFIIGRDHAGVGDYYGKYDAQKLAKSFGDLGITILDLAGPYYCPKCGGICTERSCGHGHQATGEISGTMIRALLQEGRLPPTEFMREEISRYLLKLKKKNRLFNMECADGV